MLYRYYVLRYDFQLFMFGAHTIKIQYLTGFNNHTSIVLMLQAVHT